MNDPFINHPPCYSELFHLALRGIVTAAQEHSHAEKQANRGLGYAIGGRGAGQGTQRRDKVVNVPIKPANYHYVFCSHNKPYWDTCSKCGRDKELARRNAELVLKHVGGAAFFTK